MRNLEPGAQQPYPATDPAGIGALFAVAATEVRRWLDDGLPQQDGLIDPMVCCNWLSWGRLDRSPALARRWRRYLACFRPHLQGQDEALVMDWHRSHRLYLPHAITGLRWWLPDPIAGPAQQPDPAGDATLHGPGLQHRAAGRGQLLTAVAAQGVLAVQGRSRLRSRSWRVELPPTERDVLRAITAEVVAGFRYEYRRHQHTERPGSRRGIGTCLDCALDLGAALTAAGRDWRLQGGLAARSDIANAHYWLAVAVAGGGWCPIDPSIPAIARMLGEEWPRWIDAYVGAIDARRILLDAGSHQSWPGPAQRFLSPVPGEAWCAQGDLWPCIDWVCGQTSADFDLVSSQP